MRGKYLTFAAAILVWGAVGNTAFANAIRCRAVTAVTGDCWLDISVDLATLTTEIKGSDGSQYYGISNVSNYANDNKTSYFLATSYKNQFELNVDLQTQKMKLCTSQYYCYTCGALP